MVALVTAGDGAGRASRFVTRSLTLALIGGCNARDTSGASKSANAQTWAPDQLTSIQDVPAAEVETLIQQKLEGPRPPKIDDDQWGHTKRLYKLYGNNPLLGQAIGALKQTRFLGDVVAVKSPPMAITYTISPEKRLITAFATGIIRADDLHGLIKSLLADPLLVSGMRGLYDSRYAEPDITVMQLADVAGEVRQLQSRGLERLAVVAQSETTYRVAKTFSIIARAIGIDVDVFRDLAPAQAWLDS